MKVNVAVEIGKQYLKLATVSRQGKQSRLLDAYSESISTLSDDQISQRIGNIARSRKLLPLRLSLCVSRDFVTVRNLHLPSQDPKEINDMIKLHITRVVPYKEEEILFSHRLIGTDDMGYSRLILAIVHIDMIRRQVRILENAGWMVDKITLSSYGAWKSLLHSSESEMNNSDIYILLDIDSAFTDFIIFSKANLLFTRSINIGVSGLPSMSEAILTKLFGEVKQSLIMFYNEEQNKKPAKIFISGARAAVLTNKALADIAQAGFDMPAKVIALPPRLDALNKDAVNVPAEVSLGPILELSLQEDEEGLGFILPEIQIKKTLKEKTRELVVLGSLSIYLFMLVCAVFLGRSYHRQSYLADLQQRYQSVEKEMGALFGKVKKIGFIKNYLAVRRLPLFILQQLQKNITPEIAVSYLNINDEYAVTLRGQAAQLSDVFKFINNIESSGTFKDLQTKYTRKRKLKDKEVTDFELNFKPVQ
jgi:Tfp pilus assembly PilM family ATPase